MKDLQAGTMIEFINSWTDNNMVGTIIKPIDNGYKVSINSRIASEIFVEEDDIIRVVDKNKKFVIEDKKTFLNFFDEGGEAEMPSELTIYVPMFDSNDMPVSDDVIESRVNDVAEFLKTNFGQYLVQNIGSSYIDYEGNLIMKKNVQVTAYIYDAEFETHKSHLVNQLSLWASEWNQEFMLMEFEDDMFFIMGMEDMMKQGGELWIQDAVAQMKKKGTLGAFTKQAKREGLTPIEFAKKVLNNPKGYALKTRRRAMFVKNTNPDKF